MRFKRIISLSTAASSSVLLSKSDDEITCVDEFYKNEWHTSHLVNLVKKGPGSSAVVFPCCFTK
jgi:hypothetical protein